MLRGTCTIAFFSIAILTTSPIFAGENRDAISLIRTRTEEVQVIFSIADKQQHLVTSLRPENLVVLDDGQPVTKLSSFYSSQSLPLRVTLLVDASDSMSRNFDAEAAAARWLAEHVVGNEEDRAELVEFSIQSRSRRLSDFPDHLLHNAAHTLPPAPETALFDNLVTAVDNAKRENKPARRVFLLLSDGDDNYSLHGLTDTVAEAQLAGVVIYSITVHNPKLEFPGDRVLRQLSEATGGRNFILKTYAHLKTVLDAINTELQSQYVLSFHPRPNADRRQFHRLEIRTPNFPGYKVHARSGYFLSDR